MASCKQATTSSLEQVWCCIVVVVFPPNATVPLFSVHAFQNCARVSRQRKCSMLMHCLVNVPFEAQQTIRTKSIWLSKWV